jgi:flagellar P-ring protein precursor FlgI
MKAIWLAIFSGLQLAAEPVRLKDLAAIEGVRDNQLIGYGLVVGLAGTGDKRQTVFSAQSLANVLERMGLTVAPTAMQVRNVAAVLVTANLPPYAQPGTRIDITVAAAGDATNLQGGLLLMTPLKGANGEVYAVGQGSVVTGGFMAGRGGTAQTVNHPTAGRVPAGAIVERRAPSVPPSGTLKLQLNHADFTSAARIAETINKHFMSGAGAAGLIPARAENSALVSVHLPADYAARPVEFIAEIENLTVEADRRARIVINERTGTIVMGKEVRISPVAVLHGNLTVEVQTSFAVSQPPPLSPGETIVTPEIGVGVKEEKARNLVLKQGATVEDLVRMLLSIGSTPRDVIAILQSLRAAGALEADLEVI